MLRSDGFDSDSCKSETELEYESEYDSEYDSGYEDEYEDEYESDYEELYSTHMHAFPERQSHTQPIL
ncbi:hypothetical protein RhiirA1_539613 [Rhizophagus irregularis]|uniref:Uncharacterized protein n=1 Tax=Rhizophagus irregularis TaxID=588596 RepID=A0A2N0RBV8_9GLOM|nr:hypothetical protein RhiirA1_539613 [Rhizophagus irregularis]